MSDLSTLKKMFDRAQITYLEDVAYYGLCLLPNCTDFLFLFDHQKKALKYFGPNRENLILKHLKDSNEKTINS